MHLSDLHYGDDFVPWAVRNLRGYKKRPSRQVVEGLRQAIEDTKPDYVIISGDFVNKARSEAFRDAASFLRDIFINAGIDIRSKVMLVPGNHDAPFWGRKPKAASRLKKYLRFIDSFFQDGDLEERHERFLKRDDKHSVIFLCLDTTIKSLWPTADGEIGPYQLAWAEKQLKLQVDELGSNYDRYRKIAVMHHHCLSIPGASAAGERNMQLLDAEDIKQLLRAKGFDLILHGHRHIPRISQLSRDDGAYLAVVGAGTTLAPYLDQQAGHGNNFNLIKLDGSLSEIIRFRATEAGKFVQDGDPKIFPMGRLPIKGYKVRKLRRIARIERNGDTVVTHERSGIVVALGQRIRTLPLRVYCDTPGAQIRDFRLQRCDTCVVEWRIQDPQLFEGSFVFDRDRTPQDGEASIIYEYRIDKGTAMSLADQKQRSSSSPLGYEEVSFTASTDVDDMEVEFEFPDQYVPPLEVRFEKNGVLITNQELKGVYVLRHDEATNRWLFQMHNPPLDHSITFRWKLP